MMSMRIINLFPKLRLFHIHAGMQVRTGHHDPDDGYHHDRHDPGIEEQVPEHGEHKQDRDPGVYSGIGFICTLVDQLLLCFITAVEPLLAEFPG